MLPWFSNNAIVRMLVLTAIALKSVISAAFYSAALYFQSLTRHPTHFTPKLWLKQFLEDLPNASKIEDEELEMLEREYLQGYLTEAEKAFSNLTPLGMVTEKNDQEDDEDYAEDNNNDDDDEMEMEEEHGNNEEDNNSFQVSMVSTSSESEVEVGEEPGEDDINPLATFFQQRMEISAPVNRLVTDESMIMDSDSDADDEESPGD